MAPVIFGKREHHGDFFTANENVFQALVKINTAADELGPYMVRRATGTRKNATNNQYYPYQSYVFLYASNEQRQPGYQVHGKRSC